jgi:hypothetical protein
MIYGFRTPEQLLAVIANAAPTQAGTSSIASSLPFGLDATHLHLLTNHIPILSPGNPVASLIVSG